MVLLLICRQQKAAEQWGSRPPKKTAKEPNADADLDLDDPSALHVHIIPTDENNYSTYADYMQFNNC